MSQATPRRPGQSIAELDLLLEALADRRRRGVLAKVGGADGPVSVEETAAAVCRRAPDGTEDESAVAASLVHRHLPILDEAALVRHDTEAGQVSAGERWAEAGLMLAVWDNLDEVDPGAVQVAPSG